MKYAVALALLAACSGKPPEFTFDETFVLKADEIKFDGVESRGATIADPIFVDFEVTAFDGPARMACIPIQRGQDLTDEDVRNHIKGVGKNIGAGKTEKFSTKITSPVYLWIVHNTNKKPGKIRVFFQARFLN